MTHLLLIMPNRTNRQVSLPAHLPELDGLRAIAVLLVFLDHFGLMGDTGWERIVGNSFASGYIGVDLFFVLSGFLITRILFEAKGSANYFKTFYTRRVLRIFPLYYSVLILLLVAFLIARYFLAAHLAPVTLDMINQGISSQRWAWLFLVNVEFALYGSWALEPCMTHLWSLSVEEQFYLLWPLIVSRFTRRSLMLICGGMLVAAVIFRALCVHHGNLDAAINLTPSRMDALAMGAVIALWMQAEPDARQATLLGLSVTAVCLTGAVLTYAKFGRLTMREPSIAVPIMTITPGLFAGILLLVLANRESITARFLSWKQLRFIGKISYGFYLFDGIFRRIVDKPSKAILARYPSIHIPLLLLFFVTFFIVNVLASWLSWRFFESKVLKLRDRFPYRQRNFQNLEPATVSVAE